MQASRCMHRAIVEQLHYIEPSAEPRHLEGHIDLTGHRRRTRLGVIHPGTRARNPRRPRLGLQLLAEAKAAKHAQIASEAQQALSRLEEEKARREEKERRAKPWEVTFRAVDTYELTNLTGEAAYDVRGVFFGRSMEHFPQGVDMDYRASKTFVWATTFDEDGCEEITLIWKDSPDGEDQQFTLVMPTKY